MVAPLTYIHANAYFMSKVCFGCGTFDMTERQEQELKIIHEMTLVLKLNLGNNFPRKISVSRVIEIGINTMVPRTAIAALIIKSYMSHQRMKSENGKLMQMIEINQMIESGARSIYSKRNNKVCLGIKLWTENSAKILNENHSNKRLK